MQDVFEAVGRERGGQDLPTRTARQIEDHACPGAGACGGQFTANTMATVMEMIGLSPMSTAAVPQVDPRKDERRVPLRAGDHGCGRERDSRRATSPRATAFENAIASVAATGGSTNAVLHLLAMAREAGVDLNIDDFQTISSADAAAGRSEAGGPFCRRRCRQSGRHGRSIAKRLVDGGIRGRHQPSRSPVARSPRKLPRQGNRRPGSDPAARQADQEATGGSGDPERQSLRPKAA